MTNKQTLQTLTVCLSEREYNVQW